MVGLVLFVLGNLAGGVVPVGDGVLYGWWLFEPIVRYDNIQHAIGFGAVGRAGWELARDRLGPLATDTLIGGAAIIGIGTVAGVGNEVVEWILTATIPAVDVGGYDNCCRLSKRPRQ